MKSGWVESRKQKMWISGLQKDFLTSNLGLEHERLNIFTQKFNFQKYEKYLVYEGKKQSYKYQICTDCLIIINHNNNNKNTKTKDPKLQCSTYSWLIARQREKRGNKHHSRRAQQNGTQKKCMVNYFILSVVVQKGSM